MLTIKYVFHLIMLMAIHVSQAHNNYHLSTLSPSDQATNAHCQYTPLYHTQRLPNIMSSINRLTGMQYPASEHYDPWTVKKSFDDYWKIMIIVYAIPVPNHTEMHSDFIRTNYIFDQNNTMYLPSSAFADVIQKAHLYEDVTFRDFVKCLNDYDTHFLKAYDERFDSSLQGRVSKKTYNYLQKERQRLIRNKTRRTQNEKLQKQRNNVLSHFKTEENDLQESSSEWGKLYSFSADNQLLSCQHYQDRQNVLQAIKEQGQHFQEKKYALDAQTNKLLEENTINPQDYASIFGNQLQHQLHHESLDILARTSSLTPQSPVYDYKQSLVQLTEASRLYNFNGELNTSSKINDFCFALLDYGSAILEGVAQGVVYAVQDMIDHPFQTIACVVAGEYVLAYQLLKLTSHVAKIGITYALDKDAGKQAWNEYIQPVTSLIDAISKQELTLRDGIKGATALGVSCIAQQKMLKGLGSVYKTAQVKAVAFAKNNPLVHPEMYMQTPEGALIKSTLTSSQLSNNNDTRKIKINIPSEKGILYQFPSDTIEKAIKYVMENKLIHIFDKLEHNLNPLVEKLGGRENTVRAILNASQSKLPSKGLFKDITVDVSGYTVSIRGCVIDGIPKIGTFFIK